MIGFHTLLVGYFFSCTLRPDLSIHLQAFQTIEVRQLQPSNFKELSLLLLPTLKRSDLVPNPDPYLLNSRFETHASDLHTRSQHGEDSQDNARIHEDEGLREIRASPICRVDILPRFLVHDVQWGAASPSRYGTNRHAPSILGVGQRMEHSSRMGIFG